ncbi:DMT family transporter [Janthinobacterium sp.]|uniref:DMT family transporter n=1 Tax=Janthinobacterium sp. TaxID=1871054 RepID=UPI00293D3493|nr:DMT family transporter [Janthinobacterium sp.]
MTHQFRGILALLLVTLVWGTTFPAMKALTAHFSPIWIVFIRFLLASVLMLPFLWRARYKDVRIGALVGAVLFICYVFQVEGLALTSSNRNAFITGLNVLVVPLLGYFAGKKPERRIVVALLLALAGLFTLCSEGDAAWSRGDTLALLAAFAFGLYVKMMEGAAREVGQLMTLTAMQIVTVALCSALWLLAREIPRTQIEVSADMLNYWGNIGAGVRAHVLQFLYLGVICTAAIISLQTWGQSHSTANEAAVIYAFEPGAAAFFAYFWLGEVMTPLAWMGAALLISGMIVSQWNAERPAAALVPE